MNDKPKTSKLGERVAALAKAVEGIGPKMAAEVNAVVERIDTAIAELRGRNDMTVKTLAELTTRLDQQLAEMREQIAEISKAGGASLSRPLELSATEIAEIMEAEPSRRMIAMAAHPGLGLRAGDSIDPRAKFESPIHAGQCVRAGLRVSVAPLS